MNEVAVESGFVNDQKELSIWNRSVSMDLAKFRVKGASEKRDLIVAQGIQTLDDLIEQLTCLWADLENGTAFISLSLTD